TMGEIAAGKGEAPEPFMLAGQAAAADAVWHSNRSDRTARASGKTAAGSLPLRSQTVTKRGPAAAGLPDFIVPQLCKLVSRPPSESGWVHEIKFDGYRLQLRGA